MATIRSEVLIEEAGVFVNQAEIKDPLEGSHFKIKLSRGRAIIRVLNRHPITRPSMGFELLLPGAKLSKSNGKPRLIFLLSSFAKGKSSSSVNVVVTWSFTLVVKFRLRGIIGDLAEECAQKRLKFGKSKARLWLSGQVLRSIDSVIWQIVRYDLRTGLNGWKIWGLPFRNKRTI